MTTLLQPGRTPLVSDRLAAYLDISDDIAASSMGAGDELDQIIASSRLTIRRLVFIQELDLWLVVLSNRRVLSQSLSAYPFLETATDEQLNQYELSPTGIHWPALDADLSLRGFLLAELLRPALPVVA
jgi:hypothetical protein